MTQNYQVKESIRTVFIFFNSHFSVKKNLWAIIHFKYEPSMNEELKTGYLGNQQCQYHLQNR